MKAKIAIIIFSLLLGFAIGQYHQKDKQDQIKGPDNCLKSMWKHYGVRFHNEFRFSEGGPVTEYKNAVKEASILFLVGCVRADYHPNIAIVIIDGIMLSQKREKYEHYDKCRRRISKNDPQGDKKVKQCLDKAIERLDK